MFYVFYYNGGSNDLRLFDILPNFSFAKSETETARFSHKNGTQKLPKELPNVLWLRILGN